VSGCGCMLGWRYEYTPILLLRRNNMFNNARYAETELTTRSKL